MSSPTCKILRPSPSWKREPLLFITDFQRSTELPQQNLSSYSRNWHYREKERFRSEGCWRMPAQWLDFAGCSVTTDIKICITKKTGQKGEKGEESQSFSLPREQKGPFCFCGLLQQSASFICMLLLLCFCCTYSLPSFVGLSDGKGMFLLRALRCCGKCDSSQNRPLPVKNKIIKKDSVSPIFACTNLPLKLLLSTLMLGWDSFLKPTSKLPLWQLVLMQEIFP